MRSLAFFGGRCAVLVLLASVSMGTTPVAAEPQDPWDYEKYDCLNDRWNPLDENGNRTGRSPEPGTPEWTAFNDSHVACTDQRDSDRNQRPVNDSARSASQYGEDPYRELDDHNGIRFHANQFGALEIPTVPSAEGYRPCTTAPGDCPEQPPGLQRFDSPYPVVIVMHGVIAQDIHHRFNTQTFAENGYLAFGVDGHGVGYVPGVSGPNSQRCQNAADVIEWLKTPASGEWGKLADLNRVAVAGHSQGGSCARGYQGDSRVTTIISWDSGDGIAETNCVDGKPCQPVMHQRTDGGFSSPQSYPDGYPEDRDRGKTAYEQSRKRGVNFLHLNMRDTVHTDWNGRGTGLSGNRLVEQATNHYNLGWLDLHLKGKLVIDGKGKVVTSGGRNAAQERSYRQAQAQAGFDRIIAKKFAPGSIDKHNISMGFWDPEKAEASGDPINGGNVPYRIEGTWTIERLSPFYRSYCSVSVPDHVRASDGSAGSPDAARAESGANGDMRLTGCLAASSTRGAGPAAAPAPRDRAQTPSARTLPATGISLLAPAAGALLLGSAVLARRRRA